VSAEPPGDEAKTDVRTDPIAIRVRDLHKTFGDQQHVLRGIDLDVERGKINVVIGGSGAGKTVLMRHLVVLERPDSGAILLDGEDITRLGEVKLSAVRQRFGMVFQGSALFDSMSVFDNVAFPLREHSRLSEREIAARVREILGDLGVREAEAKYPAEISGGMRKRVGLARSLVLEPAILLYDEPTTGLDPIATKNVDEMVAETAQRTGTTSVVISHDIPSTFRIGDYVSMLDEGTIIAHGTPADILRSMGGVLKRFIETAAVGAPLGPSGGTA